MQRTFVEKFGFLGALIAAAACPICFPKLALVGSAIGLGVLAPFESYVAIVVQILFIVALVGQVFAYRQHRNGWLLALAVFTTLLLFTGYYVVPSSLLLQLSLVGLAISSVWLVVEQRRCAKCEAQLSRPN